MVLQLVVLGEVPITPPRLKTCLVMKQVHVPWAWTDPLERGKQWQRDMRFGTWNVGSRCRAGSLAAAARELTRYKIDLVGVQDVRWDKGGTVSAGDYNFSTEKEMKIMNLEQVFLYNTK